MSDLLRVKDLSVTDVRNGEVIVNKLSFALRENSCLGIVGEYLAKTYLEVKHRPIYITRETEQDRDERKPAQQK